MSAVIQADSLNIPLRDESVDLIVTSPPYFALRSYRDCDEHYDGQIGSEPTPRQFLGALWAVTAECWRVLKPEGSLFVNLGDKYAGSGGHNNSAISAKSTLRGNGHVGGGPKTQATRRTAPDRYNQASDGIRAKSLMGLPWRYALGCVDGKAAPDRQRWVLRAEMVWNKPNGLPESVTDRVRRSHEQWFHLTRSERYFSGVDEIREPYETEGGKTWDERKAAGVTWTPGVGTRGTHLASGQVSNGGFAGSPLGKLPGSVWTIPSEPLIIPEAVQRFYNLPDHFAAFPQEWPRRLILGWSPSGICVNCGQGRRPVVEKQTEVTQHGITPIHKSGDNNRAAESDYDRRRTEARITGYTCACESDGYVNAIGGALPATRPAVVLDPFGGTGTTAGVARALGRTGISLDLSHDYSRLASWRIFQSGHFHKTQSRTDAERQGALL